ncbi:MAG: DUF1080 domain-containing protein, partial [Planctomycetes bacterium]|nr:DUF1080 domain-containing protein [Planctomycetota bacterium]
KGQNLCTAADHADFDLFVDWKIGPAGDSGIYLRGSPQVQIWDVAQHPEGSGGLYNNQIHPSRPMVCADRPAGEWNTMRIRMLGELVTVYLNDVLVVDDVVMENYSERDRPIYPSGSIELQNHGNPLYFKNIYLREISGPVVKKGDRVAIAGDSITEQKLYSRYMEDYLIACVPQLDLRVVQLGWSGERAPGFEARLANDLLPLDPDVVTTCYGMNDGLYRAYEPPIGDAYRRSMLAIVKQLKAAGATVVVGSPGAVDSFSFRHAVGPAAYNENLARLRDIAREIALDEGMPFANVHDPMVIAQREAKPALGKEYDVCGADGFHPRPNGHLVMAYAFLRALDLDGEIGSISVDLARGEASASDGHRVVAARRGEVEIESSRYPFCFFGDAKSPDGTRSILPYVPFNRALNRLTLKVRGLEADRARVEWGTQAKSFSRRDLERGINLAAEFLDNPFCEPFRRIDEIVAGKQAFETPMIKEAITRFRAIRGLVGEDSEAEAALATLRRKLVEKSGEHHLELRAALVPVRHTLRIVPE